MFSSLKKSHILSVITFLFIHTLLFSDLFFYLQGLDINVKWPNDIYVNGERKIGGLIVNSTIEADQAICNIGNDGKLLCHLIYG